jgi:hypothetical protein
MTPPIVSLLTRDATLDDLSATDYREMVIELRGSMSLDKLIAELRSQFSKPLWSQVEKGERPANRSQRNELRRHYAMPELPPTVAEATAQASPDAAVWQVGEGVPDHVIMVTTPEPLTIHVNGAVSIVADAADVPCNPTYTPQATPKRQRRYIARPYATEAQHGRFLALGTSWREVIDAGLTSLEAR